MESNATDKPVPREITALLSDERLILRETQRAVTPFGGVAVFISFLGFSCPRICGPSTERRWLLQPRQTQKCATESKKPPGHVSAAAHSCDSNGVTSLLLALLPVRALRAAL